MSALSALLSEIKQKFYQGTEPKKILLVEEIFQIETVLANFPSIAGHHGIEFRRLMPNVFVSNYTGANVPTGLAIEKALGHANFVLSEITHHHLP